MTSPRADVGLVGLGVMGTNLALNLADRGHVVAAYNRSPEATDRLAAIAEPGQVIVGCGDLAALVGSLERPRRIILMVKAGEVVDLVLDQLVPHLEAGDIVIDGGNSLYTDSNRRVQALGDQGLHFLGVGISGGEDGARHGPSIMPGGDPAAWPHVEGMLKAIAATAGPADDEPCCDWIGPGGAGHFVKMIHNGIEYGDMQVLAEAHSLLSAIGISTHDQGAVFDEWNAGRLESYLVEITANIMRATDADGTPMLDVILDAAGQKGTGKWTVIAAMELGQPMLLVAEAVGARIVSSFVAMRSRAADVLPRPHAGSMGDLSPDTIEDAVYTAKLISYAQGFMTLAEASTEFGWQLDLGSIARLWRAGCIIRAGFLDDIAQAYADNPELDNLLLSATFAPALAQAVHGLRRVVVEATRHGIAVPAFASAIAFYDGLRQSRGSANLIQAQRDYFGAHTYERVDNPRGEFFHTDWTQAQNQGGGVRA